MIGRARRRIAELEKQRDAIVAERDFYADWLTAVNDALGEDRNACPFVDDAVARVVAERDRLRDAASVVAP